MGSQASEELNKVLQGDGVALWNSVLFRPMTTADIAQVCHLEKQCFPAPWTKEMLTAELEKNDLACYGVLVPAQQPALVLAYGGFWHILDEAHVMNLAVFPDYQRRGLGKLLLESMITWARSLRITRMTLEVRTSNVAAQHLYAQFGFVASGVRKGYYEDNGEDAIIMWCALNKEDGGK